MKKHLLLLLGVLIALLALARDFTYTYEGQTLTYTVTREPSTQGSFRVNGACRVIKSGNISGELIIPNTFYISGSGYYSVTEIDYDAFSNCSQLTSITIPKLVTFINPGTLSNCSGLKEINVDSDNTEYSSIDGVLFAKDRTRIIAYPASKTASSYIIPNSVTSIEGYAFYGCSGLTSVTIPESVTSIGRSAFSGCSGLTSITIPNSVTSIGNSAFSGCSGLTSVTIPNSVTSIGDNAFYGCTGLTSLTIPNSVTSIGTSAFYRCSGLTSVTIPNSVTFIGGWAFYGCTGLTSVTIPNSVTSIGSSAFESCSGLTSVTIPNSVMSIGRSAFANCSGLTAVTIPNSVTSIGNYAFYDCTGLTSVTIPNSVKTIESNTFYGCTGLTSVTIPNSVTSIGAYAFSGCSGLTSVTIPSSVTSIGSIAFSGCSRLTSVTIPNSITSIGEYVFSNCSGLKEFVFLPRQNCAITNPNTLLSGCNSLEKVLLITGFDILKPVPSTAKVYTRKSLFDKVKSVNSALTCVELPGVKVTSSVSFCSAEVSINTDPGVTVTKITCDGKEYPVETKQITIDQQAPGSQHSVSTTFDNEYFSNLSESTSFTTKAIFNSTEIELVDATQSTIKVKVDYNKDDKLKDLSVNDKKCNSDGIITFTGLNSNSAYTFKASVILDGKIYSTDSYSFRTEKVDPQIEAVAITPTAITLNPGYTKGDAIIGGTEFKVNGVKYDAEEQTFMNLPVNSRVSAHFYVNNESDSRTFTLPALELNTLPARAASKDCAIICAETNMSEEEIGGGFEWRRYDAPELVPSVFSPCPVANGHMEGRLKGLSSNTYYKYRPYYQDCNGDRTFGEWTAFITADADVYFEPTVYTYKPGSVTKNSAKVVGYAMGGSEDIAEQGFEYWSMPDSRAGIEVKRVLVSGQRMIAALTDLTPGTTYKVRAFASTASKTTYGDEQEFTTAEDPDLGIEETVVEVVESELFDIYNLNGVCVRRQTKDFSGLKRGIYIANGRKIFVR